MSRIVTITKSPKISPLKVEKKSTVGAGDSMVAGFVVSLSQGKKLETAFKYGVAFGTAAAMNAGTELCNKEDADLLFQRINIEKMFNNILLTKKIFFV